MRCTPSCCRHWMPSRFSPALPGRAAQARRVNPKRMQRQVRRETADRAAGHQGPAGPKAPAGGGQAGTEGALPIGSGRRKRRGSSPFGRRNAGKAQGPLTALFASAARWWRFPHGPGRAEGGEAGSAPEDFPGAGGLHPRKVPAERRSMMDLMEVIRARHSVRSYLEQPIEGALRTRRRRRPVPAIRRESFTSSWFLTSPGPSAAKSPTTAPSAMWRTTSNCGRNEPSGAVRLLRGAAGALRPATGVFPPAGSPLITARGPRRRSFGRVRSFAVSSPWAMARSREGPIKRSHAEGLCKGAGAVLSSKAGAEAALLAPTAMNQQRFRISLEGDGQGEVAASSPGWILAL